MYIGVGGKARKVKKAYIGIGGKARLFFSSGYGSSAPGLYAIDAVGGIQNRLHSPGSAPGLYAIDAYDHRRIVKLNAATLAIESSVQVSDVNMAGGVTCAGGAAGLLWLSPTGNPAVSDAAVNDDAKIIDSRTGAVQRSLKGLAAGVPGYFSGGTTNLLYKVHTELQGTVGTVTVHRLEPDTLMVQGSFTPWANFSRTSRLNAVRGGNEDRVWIYFAYSVRDDGQTDHYPKLWEYDIATGAKTRETHMQGQTSNPYQGTMDYLDGRLYKRTYLNPNSGTTEVLDYRTLAVQSTHTTPHDLYWLSNLVTVK